MRAMSFQLDDGAFRRAFDRLDGLPVRPSVARQVFAVLTDDLDPAPLPVGSSLVIPPVAETDPGWALARARLVRDQPIDPTDVLIRRPWWISTAHSPAAAEALTQLWRHAVAVACAARRIAREANDPDPDRIARAGLMHPLALWAVAAVDPDRLAAWVNADAPGRRALEHRWFGIDLAASGRRLAERWDCDPLVVDAVWLHADTSGDLNACAAEPGRLAMIQAAYAQAQRTPWTLTPTPDRDFGPTDPRIRVLTAEVQSRTSSPFIAPDSSPREEVLTRDNLRLRRQLARAETSNASAARLVATLADASPAATPQDWADRAALAWCHEPGVASAQVVWRDDPSENLDQPDITASQGSAQISSRPAPAWVRPLGDPDHPAADLMIWDQGGTEPFDPSPTVLAGWDGWARLVADREQVARALDHAVAGHRDRVERDDATRRQAQVDALAEFAAGAGHELNNPLAVIMGRAQLVLARSSDAEMTRSLRAIITQAQRAHRILRDLMFVARPSDPRPRACQPDEIVRASLRDLKDEAEAQGVRLVLDTREPTPKVWADPEPLRQVADVLARNALEASTTGDTIRFSTGGDARRLRWTVHDTGRGITAAEGTHLFEPFYCGRQAGRGLGLGLPRVARIVDQAGGDLRWRSTPGQGATFLVTLPVGEIPGPVTPGRAETGPEDKSPMV